MTPRVLRVVRAVALLSGVGAAACSSRDDGPRGYAQRDEVPDEQASITTNDAWVNPYLDTAPEDDALDASIDDTNADDTASSDDTNDASEDTGDDDTGTWVLPETCPQPSDADDEADVDPATIDANVVVRTCRCDFEQEWMYPCIPLCTDYLEAEANGCVAGPLPPPDLPNA